MEISQSSSSVFFVGKIFTLAPFSVQKNSKGVFIIEKSLSFIVYSSSVILTMVFLTYHGLLHDANSKIPIRMKSATSKVVTALDVSVVVFATLTGTLSGIFGLNKTKELNTRLHKVDEIIGLKTTKQARWKVIILLSLPMLFITVLLALDIGTWLRVASTMKIKANDDTDVNIRWYFPFYGLYVVLTVSHISFANTILGLRKRFQGLNRLLRSSFLATDRLNYSQVINKIKVTAVQTNATNIVLGSSLASECYKINGKTKALLLKLLAECHESLGKCVRLSASYYGMTILFILVSCFLHLLATAYFLLIEIFTNNDNGFIWLQILWLIFHGSRLIAVVEPCHRLQMESVTTIHIICEIERSIHDSILAEEVKKFWQQLLVFEPRFSACGLCRFMVDRGILASIFSGIATYLVILIQFQKTNG
ncbi:gustatory receptor for sugar taste 43a-like [Haematobia irritans]|uniref:gustatory receptor for sugar taste 43a-like n=1 Tax=Haematobia irritans TaxID=7368 RepID=UPI003F4FB36B